LRANHYHPATATTLPLQGGAREGPSRFGGDGGTHFDRELGTMVSSTSPARRTHTCGVACAGEPAKTTAPGGRAHFPQAYPRNGNFTFSHPQRASSLQPGEPFPPSTVTATSLRCASPRLFGRQGSARQQNRGGPRHSCAGIVVHRKHLYVGGQAVRPREGLSNVSSSVGVEFPYD